MCRGSRRIRLPKVAILFGERSAVAARISEDKVKAQRQGQKSTDRAVDRKTVIMMIIKKKKRKKRKEDYRYTPMVYD